MRPRNAVLTIALLTAAALAGCESTHVVSNDQAVADSTVTANVKAALVQDPATRASNISVNTINGRVELTGFVNSGAQRREATDVAKNVAGVQSVRNELEVSGSAGVVVGTADNDQAVTHRVEAALESDPDTQSVPIKVTTSDGVVQLAGFVNSDEQRNTAGNIASSVEGVRQVDNDLRINPGS